MLRAVADTHAVIWYIFDDSRLSRVARDAIDEARVSGDQVGLSSITLAEIVYLTERGRIHPDVFNRVLHALDQPTAVLTELPFDRTVAVALVGIDRNNVPDLPDRVIAATAHHYKVPLITRDHRIGSAVCRRFGRFREGRYHSWPPRWA